MVASDNVPIVALTACMREVDGGPYHAVGDKYVTAVCDAAGALPLLVPALGDLRAGGRLDIPAVVARIDGLLVTGSPSNVEPRHYDGAPSRDGTRHDPARDATTLALIRAAIKAGVPLLAMCRGIQELNVALGGTLHQNVRELPGKRDHRLTPGAPHDVNYGPAHPVRLTRGGVLAGLAAKLGLDPAHVIVNSLHAQAIDRLGAGLAVEAESDDGVIEAVRVTTAPAFAIAVQWHPEYKVMGNPHAQALFGAFGDACRVRAAARAADLAREAAE